MNNETKSATLQNSVAQIKEIKTKKNKFVIAIVGGPNRCTTLLNSYLRTNNDELRIEI